MVGLEGTGLCRRTESRTDHEGRTSTQTVSAPYLLHAESRQHSLAIGPGQSVFTVPEWAPPSSESSVSWNVYARVVRERGGDEDERLDVVVRLPGQGLPTERVPQEGEDGLVIEQEAVAVALGDTVTGNVAVTLAEDARAKDLTVSLQRRVVTLESKVDGVSVLPDGPLSTFEFATGLGTTVSGLFGVNSDDVGAWNRIAVTELPVDRDLMAGSLERLPFSLDVPAGAGPTTAHQTGRVEWRIAASLDRKGAFKDDLEAQTPLFVY